MAKKGKRNRRLFIIVESLLCIVMIISGVIWYYYDSETKRLNDDYSSKSVEFNENNHELKIVENQLEEINKEIEKYNNIDNSIVETKKEYYSKIKELEDKILNGESNKKIAYLTFDDGPYYNTYKVFDILEKNNVNATFFLTNTNGEHCFDKKSENCYSLYKEYEKRGHTIANHTFTHAIFKGLYSSPNSFIDAVVKQQDHIKEQSGGYITNILRFPGGIPTAKSKLGSSGFEKVTEELRKMGYGWVDWTAEDGDGKDVKSVDAAWKMLTSMIDEDIEVILFHDYCKETTELLPRAIEYLRNKGYVLLPLFYESNVINK